MYLYRETYVKNWDHLLPKDQHQFEIKKGGVIRKDIKPERICYIVEEVAYWRKFNALHNWFVTECGNGEDKCQKIYVENSMLEELLKTLKEVKLLLNSSKLITRSVTGWKGDVEIEVYDCEDQIMDLFPPTPGFFFGSTEITELYKQDVEDTIVTIENLLKEQAENVDHGLYGGDFYYRASW
jgi:hypothetical protein